MKKIMFYLSLVIFLICIICSLVLFFKNPDMTELRLVITYWKEYSIIAIFVLAGSYMFKKSL